MIGLEEGLSLHKIKTGLMEIRIHRMVPTLWLCHQITWLVRNITLNTYCDYEKGSGRSIEKVVVNVAERCNKIK